MGNNEDRSMDMGFQNRGDSSGISTNSFFAPAWDPVASLGRHENFGVSQSEFTSCLYSVVLENQAISSTSHFGHYPSGSSFAELVPKFPSFGSENFSDMVGSFGLTDCGPIANSGCPPSYIPNKQDENRRVGKNGAQSLEDQQLSGEAAVASSPNGQGRKRMADSNSPLDPSKAEGEVQKDPGESFDLPKEQDQKKPRPEQNTGSNIKGKQIAKQAKDNSPNREAPKENYIHIRARRGQATNSHSLAERVRREKISERMRLLQELVPGCNKITGKAVMLDEIINYVQSLQQQVEFLSMKLATVNPELNIDLERLLSKDILHSRGGNAAIMGFTPGMNPHAYPHGIFQTGTPIIPNTNSQLPSMPQAVLENEFQSVFQMGFNSGPVIDNLGPNGRLKPEL